ncbi:MAG: TOBE domain-containing protein, partial [Melioribacteraceae bacterium]|nr:TOBE domain-containing protein [Melioribacteraceae bacterium]
NKIVIMKDGEVQQIGAPLNLYNNPVNKFVAGFIGSPSMNFIDGNLINKDGLSFQAEDNSSISLSGKSFDFLSNHLNEKIVMGIRPEDFKVDSNQFTGNGSYINAKIEVVEPLGNETFLYFSIKDTQLIARVDSATKIEVDEMLKLHLDLEKIFFFDENEIRLN